MATVTNSSTRGLPVTHEVTDYRDRAAACTVVSTGAGAVLTTNIQIQAYGQDEAYKYPVRIGVTTATGLIPSATNNTIAFSAGTILETVLADASYIIEPDSTGLITFTTTLAADGDRVVRAWVDSKPAIEGEVITIDVP
jgi:hypothetical protein